MSAQTSPVEADRFLEGQRISQMHNLLHFLDAFASGDPIMRAGAAHFEERLREDGCDGEEVIRIAATALLVVIEDEIDKKTRSGSFLIGV